MEELKRNNRKVRVGIVASDTMDKSVTVVVQRILKHPRYSRVVRRNTRLLAHDENNEARRGDRVEVMETRPLSKHKHWRVTKVLRKAN